MSRREGLVQLGLRNEDWGPCADDKFAHAEFAAKWRGVAPCPTEAQITQACTDYASAQAAIDQAALLYDNAMTHGGDLALVLKALVLALNDGSFVPGQNYSAATIKSKLKAKL